MDRRSFLQTLSVLSLSGCHAGAPRADATGADVGGPLDERIDARIAERSPDYVTLLEATPNILRRAPSGTAESMRKTLREHPEAVAEMNGFRVSALTRLKKADIEPEAKRLMLDAQLEKVPHAVTTCMEHFLGVFELLKAWGHPDEIAKVGLFHAMYGTEFFVLDLFDYRRPADRVRLRNVVGEKTERWILQYALMLSRDFVADARQLGTPPPRLDFFEEPGVIRGDIVPADFFALAELQVANAYEPFTHSGKEADLASVSPYAPLRSFVSNGAKGAIDAASRSVPEAR